MYKSAEQYLGPSRKMNELLMDPYKVNHENFHHPHTLLNNITVNNSVNTPLVSPSTSQIPQTSLDSSPSTSSTNSSNKLHIKWETKEYTSLMDPEVWGRPFWFGLHVSGANYPIKASNMVRDLMVGRLLALPHEIPCAVCRPHASAFIEANKHRLPDICSGRDKLFNFYVDFHNKVNERYGKPQMSYENARKMWMNGIKVSTMSY